MVKKAFSKKQGKKNSDNDGFAELINEHYDGSDVDD